MKKFHLIIILFLTLFGNAACGQNYTPDILNEIRTVENGLIPGILVKGEPEKRYTLTERMAFYNVPGLSIAVIRDGKIRWAKGYGIANTRTGKAVDVNTIFQAGSISKPLAALGALLLVQEGKVDLDTDVNTYLKTWKVPENEFTKTEKVTLRRLLTHSAGMTVHGFPGYSYLDKFPDIETVLNGKGNTPAIFVDVVPGTIWRYSGGGYTVMEKMVEDMTGMPLEKYLAKKVLRPLGMKNSTYEQPLPKKRSKQASAAYHGDGKIVEGLWHNYPEQAAAGLWTTPSDLARYCIEIQEALAGKSHKVLNQETVGKMLTKHLSNWGLGPSLRWDADSLIFQHGGKNEGFTNNMMAFARRGDGLIVMTSADRRPDSEAASSTERPPSVMTTLTTATSLANCSCDPRPASSAAKSSSSAAISSTCWMLRLTVRHSAKRSLATERASDGISVANSGRIAASISSRTPFLTLVDLSEFWICGSAPSRLS